MASVAAAAREDHAGAAMLTPADEGFTQPFAPLVALMGEPHAHDVIRAALAQDCTPGIACLSFPRADAASSLGISWPKHHSPAAVTVPAVNVGGADAARAQSSGAPGLAAGVVSPQGILKREWLARQRSKRPAAVLALLRGEEVLHGDPGAWGRAAQRLDDLRESLPKTVRLVLVVLQQVQPVGEAAQLTEERLGALRRRMELEGKSVLSLCIASDEGMRQEQEQEQEEDGAQAAAAASLQRLCRAVGELVMLHYHDEGRRYKACLARQQNAAHAHTLASGGLLGDSAPQVQRLGACVKYSYKAAACAMFEQDPPTALKYLGHAYEFARQLLVASDPTVAAADDVAAWARLLELKEVAEHLLRCMLELRVSSGQLADAAALVRRHRHLYKGLHLQGPAALRFLHWAWMARPHERLAAMLARYAEGKHTASYASAVGGSSSSAAASALAASSWEEHAGFHYAAAARFTARRRRAFEEAAGATSNALQASDVVLASSPQDVGLPLYLGRPPLLLRRGATAEEQSLAPEELAGFLLAREANVQHSHKAIELLTLAHQHYTTRAADGPRAGRVLYELGAGMAQEYLRAGDFQSAQRLYEGVAAMYRREGWELLLSGVLPHLQHCARELRQRGPYLEHCLAIATLPVESAPQARAAAFAAAAAVLQESAAESAANWLPAIGGDRPEPADSSCMVSLVVGGRSESDAATATDDRTEALSTLVKASGGRLLRAASSSSAAAAAASGFVEMQVHLWTGCPAPLRLGDVSVTCRAPVDGAAHQPVVLLPLESDTPLHELVLATSEAESQAIRMLLPKDCTYMQMPELTLVGKLGELCRLSFSLSHIILPTSAPLASPTSAEPMELVSEPTTEAGVQLHLHAPSVAFVGERILVEVEVCTSAGVALLDGGVLQLQAWKSENQGERWTTIAVHAVESGGGQEDDGQFEQRLPALGGGASHVAKFEVELQDPTQIHLRAHAVGQVAADSQGGAPAAAIDLEQSCAFVCDEPFELLSRVHSTFRMDALLPKGGAVATGHPCSIILSITQPHEVPLGIHSVKLNCGEGWQTLASSVTSEDESAPAVVSKGDSVTELFQATCSAEGSLSPGEVVVQWSRCVEGMAAGTPSKVEWSMQLPAVNVEVPAFVAAFKSDAAATVGVPFPLALSLSNGTSVVQDMALKIVDASNFVFVGDRATTVSVPPMSAIDMQWQVVPITSGKLALPQVQLTSSRYGAILQSSAQSRSIYVKPRAPSHASPLPSQPTQSHAPPAPAAVPPPAPSPVAKLADPAGNGNDSAASQLESAFDALKVSDVASPVGGSLI